MKFTNNSCCFNFYDKNLSKDLFNNKKLHTSSNGFETIC